MAFSMAVADETLYSGELGSRRNSPLRGTWSIVTRDEGERVLILDENFQARGGPDLKIFFSTLPLEDIYDRNAGDREYAVRIAHLQKFRGGQEYILPESLDLEEYRTWIVHCERYAHFWDGAELITPEDESEADTDDQEADTDDQLPQKETVTE